MLFHVFDTEPIALPTYCMVTRDGMEVGNPLHKSKHYVGLGRPRLLLARETRGLELVKAMYKCCITLLDYQSYVTTM